MPISRKHSRKQILVVDDDPDSCEMLAVFLTSHEFDVVTAATVAAGLALARQQRFDLHVLDWHFPDGNGPVLCQQMGVLNTPLVIWSSDAQEETRQQALSAGAAAFFTKPIDLDRFLVIVQQLTQDAGQAIDPTTQPTQPTTEQWSYIAFNAWRAPSLEFR